MKKLLTLLLVISMIISIGSVTPVLAAENTDAVKVLTALDILIGDENGNLNLDKPITRAEYTTILLRILDVNQGHYTTEIFTDVPVSHWAHSAITNAYNLKIVNGCGDGTFKPENSVSYEEAVKMIMCVLGYEPYAVSRGGYPTGYLVAANQNKVTEGVTTKMTRADVAQLIYNALSTPVMEQTSYGNNVEYSILNGKNNTVYESLLTKKDIYIASGIVGDKDITEDTIEFNIKEKSEDLEFTIGKEIFNIKNSNIGEYKNEYVDVYVQEIRKNEYDVIIAIPSVIGNSIVINSEDIKEIKNNRVEYYTKNNNIKSIKLNELCVYSLNTNDCDDIEELLQEDIELTFVENTGDNEFDIIIGTKYAAGRIYGVNKNKLKIDNKWIEFDFDSDVEYIFEDSKGNTIDFEDFEEDDVIAIVSNDEDYKDASYLKLIKLTDNTVVGMVTEISENYVWINGNKYEDNYGLKLEDEGTFYISMTNKIFDFEGVSAADDYAYILEAAIDSASAFSKDTWTIRVLTKTGVKDLPLTEEASKDYNDILETIGMFENTSNLYENRVITFKTNSKGLVRTLEFVNYKEVELDEYNSKTQKLDGNIIEDTTLVYDVSSSKVESTIVTDIDYLVDEGEYQGLVVKEDNDVKLLVITDSKTKLSNELGFAIVTSIKNKKVDGQDVISVDYIQNMEEKTIVFDEDSNSVLKDGIAIDKLNIGSVFMVNGNDYLILGTMGEDGYINIDQSALNEFSKDNEFIYGYIANEDSGKNKKYETIEVGGIDTEDISISKDTNTYCYYNGRNIEIKTSYITEDADWYTEDEATFFFARIIDGSVIDIYTFNNRAIGKEAIAEEAKNAFHKVIE